MNSAERIGKLFFLYTRNELSNKEKAELAAWRKTSRRNEEFFQTHTNPENIRESVSRIYNSRDRVFQKIKEGYPEPWEKKPVRRISYRSRIIRIAAIFILVLSFGLYFLLPVSSVGKPGTFKAELISSNGASQALDDFQRGLHDGLAGLKIQKNEKGELIYVVPVNAKDAMNVTNMVRTPRGGMFLVRFPDSTLVWLNAKSSITYPMNFSRDSIHLVVTGEIYIEISKHSTHSYIITTPQTTVNGQRSSANDQRPTVIGQRPTANGIAIKPSAGARINLNGYADLNHGITLIDGVANIAFESGTGNDSAEIIMHSGDEANWRNDAMVVSNNSEEDQALAWKNGMIYFRQAKIQSIMDEVSRWYNIDVDYMGTIPDKKFDLNLARDTELQKLLTTLNEQGIHLSLHDGKIIVAP
jgi:transmembrane sensor